MKNATNKMHQKTMTKTYSNKPINNQTSTIITLIQIAMNNGFNQKTASFTKFKNKILHHLKF